MPKTNPTCDTYKQHVALSDYANKVIKNDATTFWGKTNDSGIINTIIQYFQHFPWDKNDYLYARFPKDVNLKIRLRKDSHTYLYPTNIWQRGESALRQCEFIKLIVEHYARQPFYIREQIIYWNTKKNVNDLISSSSTISLIISNTQFIVKPYRFSDIFESGYNYLIGMSRLPNETEYQTASFRLSRIGEYNKVPDSEEELSESEKRLLDNSVKDKGVEFLLGDIRCFQVMLTPLGKDIYDTTYHLRPMHDRNTNIEYKGENVILTFKCTERQIRNYFFKFGENAIVISPSELKTRIKDEYKAAYQAYS